VALLVVATAAAAAGAGCGGSESTAETPYRVEADTTVTTASFAKARLVPRINKICRRGWAKIAKNFDEYSSWQDPKEDATKRFTEAVKLSLMAGVDYRIFDEIYRQGAPRGEERKVEKIIGSMQSAVERGQKGLAPVSTPAQVLALFGDFNQRARRFGLHDCLFDETDLR
jgi:hypothetical protein